MNGRDLVIDDRVRRVVETLHIDLEHARARKREAEALLKTAQDNERRLWHSLNVLDTVRKDLRGDAVDYSNYPPGHAPGTPM